MIKKIFSAVSVIFVFATAQASSIECHGTYVDKEAFYFSSNPKAPYDQYVKKSCGLGTVALDGDFYSVYAPRFEISPYPCDTRGLMSELQMISKKDSDSEVELLLGMCERTKPELCPAKRGLRINKRTKASTYFNVLENGKWFPVTASLKCQVSE